VKLVAGYSLREYKINHEIREDLNTDASLNDGDTF